MDGGSVIEPTFRQVHYNTIIINAAVLFRLILNQKFIKMYPFQTATLSSIGFLEAE